MKRLMTIGLSCWLMTGCGEPLPGDVAPSAAAPSLDPVDEIMGDAPTMEAVEEQASTECRRSDELGAEDGIPIAVRKIVVSCGSCKLTVLKRKLIYDLEAVEDGRPVALPERMHMTLVSWPNSKGFEASFLGPPSGSIEFGTAPLTPTIVLHPDTEMRLRFCVDGEARFAGFHATAE